MASTGETWRLGRRPALDGLRGVAVVLVVAGHAHLICYPGVGVDLFFALSGFLITSLLLEEWGRTGRMALGAFYARRVRRLMPALVVMVAATAYVGWLLGISSWWAPPLSGVVASLLYLTDFTAAAGHFPGALGHTWSLAIEEQFYLTWPFALMLLARRGRLAVFVAATAASALVCVRLILLTGAASNSRVEFGLDTRTAPILAGCALAAWFHGTSAKRTSHPLFGGCALAALIVLAVGASSPLAHLPATLASVALLWTLAEGRQQSGGPLTWAWLRWLGARSYGIYLWHHPVAVLTDWIAPEWSPLLRFLVVATLATGLAAASFAWVERPLLARSQVRAGQPTFTTAKVA